MANSEMDRVRAWVESPEGAPVAMAITLKMVYAPDAPECTSADVWAAIVAAYHVSQQRPRLSAEDLAEIREWVKVYKVRRNTSHTGSSQNDGLHHIAGYVPVLLDEVERLQGELARLTDDPFLSSPDLPPLPWRSRADRQPWVDGAGNYQDIVDANGQPVLCARNWKEQCAAIEYLVRMSNRGARVIPK